LRLEPFLPTDIVFNDSFLFLKRLISLYTVKTMFKIFQTQNSISLFPEAFKTIGNKNK